jgi:SAM-dependent methyltransferase
MPDNIYNVVEKDYDSVSPSFHNSYDSTQEFEDEIKVFSSKLSAKSRILNIGGTASECKYFLGKNFIVVNLDVSQTMLAHISKSSQEISVVKGNIKDYLSEELYDGIWACRSLIHIPPLDLPTTLKNIHRLLKKGGYFGAVFFLSKQNHLEEELVPETHTNKKGILRYRVLYSKEEILEFYRKAQLKTTLRKECTDRDGDKSIFILAQRQ